jgi:hypothetical protein
MAVSDGIASYLKALENQKALISSLGSSSGGKIPGLTVDAVIKNLAKLNTDLKQTYDYYDSQIEVEASNEEQKAADSGIVETEAQKKARRDAKKKEAKKKGKEIYDRYKKTLEDFVQEQISIIQVNYGIIKQETKDLPKIIALAITTSLLPTAVGAAVPNYAYNLGVLYQNLQAIKRSLGNIKSSFLNILIAADKIKFALPSSVTETLEKIINLESLVSKKSPSEESIDQSPPPAPVGSRITLLVGEFSISEFNIEYATVTEESKFGINIGQVGKIVNVTGNSKETITSIEIEVTDSIPPPPGPPPEPEPAPEEGGKNWDELTTGGKIVRALTFPANLAFRKKK